jgi:probable dihydroxyacetone kinase regulator
MGKRYKTSETTCQAISGALKQLMTQKPLERITVAEIMDTCGMRRQHFYYYFTDIYDLLRWTFEKEALELLQQQQGVSPWQNGFLHLFQYINQNRAVCLCALDSLGKESLKQLLEADVSSEKSNWNQDQSKSKEDQIRDHFQDLSDSCAPAKQHDGRISASENKGEITGSTNLGGIVGSVGIEIDFDPDGDTTKVGNYSLDFHYQTRALLTGCTNSGTITGRNDYAGGIVGQAYIGQLTDCQSYGAVSTDGSYVGGIAGCSDSSIRLSWAKCALSGEDYVGGIAGYGKTISDCRSLVTVDGGAYTGAIAGDVDEDGSVTGCLFTHETLGAIDGISYAGKAEPAAFDVLCAGDTVPKTFSQMELTFRADGKVVAVVPFQYGRGIDSLPEIPAKKGFSAVWPDLDYTHLTASQTLDAVYTPYTSSLTDDTQTLPQILVDGSFSSRATVSHTSEPVSWTDAKGTARTGTAVTVTVDDPDMTAISYTVHYRLPEDGKRYDLWVKTESGWEKQDSTVDGSYLLFTSDRETVTFCVQERTASSLLWVLLAVLILLTLMLVVIRIRKKRGRQTIRSRLRKARQKKS